MKTIVFLLSISVLLSAGVLKAQDQDINGNVNAGAPGSYWQGFRSNAASGIWGFQQNDVMMVGIGGNVYKKGFSANAMGIFNGSVKKEDVFLMNQNDPFADFLVLKSSGFVGINTSNPREQLSVNGKIRAQEIKVESTNWPDYVFLKTYELPSLRETGLYIKKNGHLPEVPTASEIEQDGISVGAMNALLLKKVEELTLHLIEMDNKMQNKEQEINDLTSRLSKLEKERQ
ncbi:hypothetical protein [Pararcticibacter amylolyticus]|uniref:Peptidase S74 domain-containing protein n=1 Tax=Pararcticibacter amylolyticus TaxID=2173175 RepID=A0A2U2P9V1_9SPHI|nr:hypothetical protein [Pararcticibacter amylolyticus]PWG78074.1 hypothetical protein DDR33_24185 [Pararcticibacter amylolyticus]